MHNQNSLPARGDRIKSCGCAHQDSKWPKRKSLPKGRLLCLAREIFISRDAVHRICIVYALFGKLSFLSPTLGYDSTDPFYLRSDSFMLRMSFFVSFRA